MLYTSPHLDIQPNPRHTTFIAYATTSVKDGVISILVEEMISGSEYLELAATS